MFDVFEIVKNDLVRTLLYIPFIGRSSHRKFSIKKAFLKISQIFPRPADLLKRGSGTDIFL